MSDCIACYFSAVLVNSSVSCLRQALSRLYRFLYMLHISSMSKLMLMLLTHLLTSALGRCPSSTRQHTLITPAAGHKSAQLILVLSCNSKIFRANSHCLVWDHQQRSKITNVYRSGSSCSTLVLLIEGALFMSDSCVRPFHTSIT
jgi:hypothetical protein